MKSYVPITQVEVDSSNPDGTRDLAVTSHDQIDSLTLPRMNDGGFLVQRQNLP